MKIQSTYVNNHIILIEGNLYLVSEDQHKDIINAEKNIETASELFRQQTNACDHYNIVLQRIQKQNLPLIIHNREYI